MFDLLTTTASFVPLLVPMDITIDPNTNGLPGINQLRTIVGAVMTIGLILSVLALIVSAIVWGFGANSSNPHLASRGKVGVLVSCVPRVSWRGARTGCSICRMFSACASFS